jgi:hypothetical protein
MKWLLIVPLAAVLALPALVIWIGLLVREGFGWIADNHAKASESARDTAKATVVVSKVAMFWAWLVAPSGLTAMAAAMGLASTPVIVVAAPILIAVSGATVAVASALELYSKRRREKQQRK